SILNCLTENNSNATPPIITVAITVMLPQPLSAALLKPYTIPPKPIVDKIIERISIFGLVIVETFCIYFNPDSNASTKNGSEIQKIQFQLRFSIIKPDIEGPIAGANIITSPINPIVAPRLLIGNMTKIVL